MGILFLFVLVVIGFIAVVGAAILYQLGYWIGLRGLQLPLSSRTLWAIVCVTACLVNLYGLLFLLNDSKGDTPDTSIVWKFLMGVSLLISIVTYFFGLRLIKQ